jgi:hypothetical protein
MKPAVKKYWNVSALKLSNKGISESVRVGEELVVGVGSNTAYFKCVFPFIFENALDCGRRWKDRANLMELFSSLAVVLGGKSLLGSSLLGNSQLDKSPPSNKLMDRV